MQVFLKLFQVADHISHNFFLQTTKLSCGADYFRPHLTKQLILWFIFKDALCPKLFCTDKLKNFGGPWTVRGPVFRKHCLSAYTWSVTSLLSTSHFYLSSSDRHSLDHIQPRSNKLPDPEPNRHWVRLPVPDSHPRTVDLAQHLPRRKKPGDEILSGPSTAELFQVQCMPLNVITLGPGFFDHIKRMIIITDDFCELFFGKKGPEIW